MPPRTATQTSIWTRSSRITDAIGLLTQLAPQVLDDEMETMMVAYAIRLQAISVDAAKTCINLALARSVVATLAALIDLGFTEPGLKACYHGLSADVEFRSVCS